MRARRVQFDMPDSSFERLAQLKDKTEATSYNEVIRNALRLYEAVIEEYESGSEFLVRTQQGELKTYLIF